MGRMKLAPWGEKAVPASIDITSCVSVFGYYRNTNKKLTCFGQIETFLAQVRHQSKDSDKPAKDRAHNVEIAELEGRHFRAAESPKTQLGFTYFPE